MSSARDPEAGQGPDESREARVAEPPAAPRDSVLDGGALAGRFAIEAMVGRGPSSTVYRARRESDQAKVALKLVHARYAHDERILRRVAREAEAARAIDHPNVARVLEHGVDADGRAFVCREWVQGVPITQTEGPLTPRRISAWLCDVLSALAEAHRHGVIHGDLQPNNLLVVLGDQGERCQVCDFGGARLHKPKPGSAYSDDGALCGAADYMAPEQARGARADGRSDVYVVGAILYQLLTGEPPFRGPAEAAVLEAHLHATLVPPREKRPGYPIPRELESVCLKALAKRPEDRYQSPLAMMQALRASIELLRGRADSDLGTSAFSDNIGKLADSVSERMTVPGEQLRSRTKVWLGVGLVALACAAIWMQPVIEHQRREVDLRARDPGPAPVRATAAVHRASDTRLDAAERALANGADPGPTIAALRRLEPELGHDPRWLRLLGEALLRAGVAAEGKALLERYLRQAEDAPDRTRIEALLAH